MSLIGKEIGDFSVQSYQNNAFKTVTKQDVIGKDEQGREKWSLFFFYPADFSFVCPTELEELAEEYDAFKAHACEIYSVSCDSHFVHKAWHDASERVSKVQYPMLADPACTLARDFDVLIDETGLAERGAFIVDPDGRIQVYEVTSGSIGRNEKELLRLLEAAQFVREHGDEVCPAKWEPGEETLKPSLDLVGQL